MAIVAKRPDGDAPDQGAALPVHVPPVNLASGAAQLSILPHEGRVSLGRCASDPPQMQLVHKDTLEVRILAAGPDWQLVFDEDGYGAVTDMDGAADPIVLEQFLDRTLCEADDGTLAIIERKGGRTRVWSLSAKLAGFTRIRVRVLVGPTQSKEEMLAVLLAWPRQQSRVMWNSLRFYTLLCLKSYSSQPSKWVWSSSKAWIEYLDCLGFEGRYHVMGSQQASRCNMDEAQAPVLPHLVLSTLAVLALCVRWAAHVPQAGGLRDPRGQNAALAFLEGLLQGVSAIRSFCLQVRFVESWVCPYPHEEATAPDMTLRVSAEGYVNVAEWVAMVDQGHPLAIEWWTKFVAPEIATVGLSLVRLLTRCSMEARHRSLFSQLLYQLAFRCEVCVAGSLRSPPPRTQGLRAQAVDIMDVINHNSRLNFELLQYNYASMKATENADYVSIANDKGNVGGLQLPCGVIALPNNKAFVACPQVCNTIPQPCAPLDDEGRRALAKDMNTRHRLFLRKRVAPASQSEAWRPQKRYRLAAVKWCKALDTQVRFSTAWSGLSHAQFLEGSPVWSPSNWRRWPCVGTVQDQGSDGLCGWHSLAYMKKINTTAHWDWAHGAARDMDGALKSTNLWSFVILMLVILNMGHGPDRDECLQFHQFNEMLLFCMGFSSPDTCELFSAYATDMLSELGSRVSIGDGERAVDALWRFVKDRASFPKLGHRLRMCQFMGWRRATCELLPCWTETLFKAELLCLECDLFGNRGFQQKVLIPKAVLHQSETIETTSASVMQVDARLLRSCAQNAVVIAAITLQSRVHRRLSAIITSVGEPLNLWYGKAAKELKSVHANSEWLQEQMSSGIMGLCDSIFEVLRSPDNLEEGGFFSFQQATPQEKNGPAMADDDLAAKFGHLCLELVAHRMRRLLYFIGCFPHRFLELLLGADRAEKCRDEFKMHSDIFRRLVALEHKPRCLKDLLDRSVFNTIAVQQWLCGFEQSAWAINEALTSLARERSLGITSSLIIEDMLNMQKNSQQIRGSRRMRRPERCMGIALGKKLVGGRYSYDEVVPEVMVGKKKNRLDKAAFGVGQGQPSIDMSGIAGTKAQAPFFSPSAENTGKPAADMTMLKYVSDNNDYDAPRKAFFGCVSDPQHMIVFRRSTPSVAGASFDWVVGLGSYNDSCALVWPVTLQGAPGHEAEHLEVVFDRKLWKPVVLPIVSWEGIRARPTAWKSWSWQVDNLPNAQGHASWSAAIRLFVVGPELELMKCAARQAWWRLGLTQLQNIASFSGIQVDKHSNLFDTLVGLTGQVLGESEEEVLAVLRQRLARLQTDSTMGCSEEILELDEAAKVLEQSDEKAVVAEKKHARAEREKFKQFAEQFREEVAHVRKTTGAVKKKQAGGRRSAGQTAPSKTRLPANGRIAQAQAKLFMPPDSYVWQSRTEQARKSRVPPFSEVSRSWRKHGQEQALYAVVVDAWEKHCLLNGLDKDSCPMSGVFPGSAGASASSSSVV